MSPDLLVDFRVHGGQQSEEGVRAFQDLRKIVDDTVDKSNRPIFRVQCSLARDAITWVWVMNGGFRGLPKTAFEKHAFMRALIG